jgi:hypothetical protein
MCGEGEFGHNMKEIRGTGKNEWIILCGASQEVIHCAREGRVQGQDECHKKQQQQEGCLVTGKYKTRQAGSNIAVRCASGSPASK